MGERRSVPGTRTGGDAAATGRARPADRGVVPVVGKALEAAVVVLFVALLTTVLFGGVVPAHRSAVADELADRTLSTAVERVEGTARVPDATVRGERRVVVALPRSIRRSTYRVRYDANASFGTTPNGTNATSPALVLDHPRDALDRRIPVRLPPGVTVSGAWDSGTDCVVRVDVAADGTTLELANRGGDGGRVGADGGDAGA